MGRKLKCGVCETKFLVPAETPHSSYVPDARTRAHSVDLQEAPDELRAALRKRKTDDTPTVLDRPARRFTDTGAERKAFDLDKKGRIKPRTGAHLVDLSTLELPLLDEDDLED